MFFIVWRLDEDWREPFGMLAAAFGWAPDVLDELLLEDIPHWVKQAKRWGFGGAYGRKT